MRERVLTVCKLLDQIEDIRAGRPSRGCHLQEGLRNTGQALLHIHFTEASPCPLPLRRNATAHCP